MTAAIDGDLDKVKSLIKKKTKLPKSILQKNDFFWLAQKDDIRIVEALVEAGADVNANLSALLSANPDQNLKNKKGETTKTCFDASSCFIRKA